jgi:hypothetical protein
VDVEGEDGASVLGRSVSGHRDQVVGYCQGRSTLARKNGSQSVAAVDWPKDLIDEVKRILGVESVAPRAPVFQFKMDSESAEKNVLFLSNHDLNLSKAFLAQKGSPLDYGSEFKPVGILKPLFKHHPSWQKIS